MIFTFVSAPLQRSIDQLIKDHDLLKDFEISKSMKVIHPEPVGRSG